MNLSQFIHSPSEDVCLVSRLAVVNWFITSFVCFISGTCPRVSQGCFYQEGNCGVTVHPDAQLHKIIADFFPKRCASWPLWSVGLYAPLNFHVVRILSSYLCTGQRLLSHCVFSLP